MRKILYIIYALSAVIVQAPAGFHTSSKEQCADGSLYAGLTKEARPLIRILKQLEGRDRGQVIQNGEPMKVFISRGYGYSEIKNPFRALLKRAHNITFTNSSKQRGFVFEVIVKHGHLEPHCREKLILNGINYYHGFNEWIKDKKPAAHARKLMREFLRGKTIRQEAHGLKIDLGEGFSIFIYGGDMGPDSHLGFKLDGSKISNKKIDRLLKLSIHGMVSLNKDDREFLRFIVRNKHKDQMFPFMIARVLPDFGDF